jgi:hypothetical protein
MTILTISASLPSELVTTATAGTSSDWLLIQKSGESVVSKIAAVPAACGAAALAGASTQDFACKTITVDTGIVVPNTSTIWNASYSSGIDFSGTRIVTFYAADFRCYDAAISDWAPITAKSIYCSGGNAVAEAFYFTDDGDTGIESGGTNYLDMVAGGTTQATFYSGYLASKNIRPLSGFGTYKLGDGDYYWSDVRSASYTTVSDLRTKDDVLDCDLGLEFITALRPVSYRRKSKVLRIEQDQKTGKDQPVRGPGVRRHYGLISQEVKATLKNRDFGGHVYDAEADMHALRYNEFIAPLIKAIQELTARVAALESA